jgi:hypothetical protein
MAPALQNLPVPTILHNGCQQCTCSPLCYAHPGYQLNVLCMLFSALQCAGLVTCCRDAITQAPGKALEAAQAPATNMSNAATKTGNWLVHSASASKAYAADAFNATKAAKCICFRRWWSARRCNHGGEWSAAGGLLLLERVGGFQGAAHAQGKDQGESLQDSSASWSQAAVGCSIRALLQRCR